MPPSVPAASPGSSTGLYSFGAGGGNFSRMPGSNPMGSSGSASNNVHRDNGNEGLISGTVKRLSRIKIPFRAPSLLDKTKPYFSGIKRFGISKVEHYWKDPFHTLLNLPWPRFILIFFMTYMVEFMIFAFLFWAQTNRCVINMEGKFAHALWMSSRAASTLGFDTIRPNPECPLTNLTVMLQVIASSLINFIMLGLVFARFSAPFKRASTIRFSSISVVNRHSSGYWAIGLRVANMRKHQILKPSLRMVMTAVDSITPSNYIFEHLKIEAIHTQETNLELGFPANVVHIITPESPLYNLSLLEMETRMMEVLVFVDGIDAMTSKNMSARHAYNTNEVRMNEMFLPLHLEMRGKSLGLDFGAFDATTIASTELLSEYNADPSLANKPLPEVQSHMWHLRHQTFKRLADHYQQHQQQLQAQNSLLNHGPSLGHGIGNSRSDVAFPAGPSAGSGSAAHSPYVAAASGASAQQLLARGGVSLSAGTTPTAGGASPSAGSWGGLGIPLQPGGGSVGTMPPAPVPSGLGGLGPYPISAYLTNFPGSQLPAAPGSLPGEGDDSFVAVAPAAPAPAATHHHSHHRAAAAAPHGGSVLPVSTQQVEMLPTSTAPHEPRANGGAPWPL